MAHAHLDRRGTAADGLIADDAGLLSGEHAAWVTAAMARNELPLLGVRDRDRDRTMLPQSDGEHWHFSRQRIPSLRLTGLWQRAQRTVADDALGIDFDAYAAAVRALTAVVAELADRPALDRTGFSVW